MVFNSLTFLIFCALFFPLYYKASFRQQNSLLLVASYLFYGWWDWRFTGLLFITTLIDFWLARGIESSSRQSRRKTLLTLSMVTNLATLGVFKYYNFFSEELRIAFLKLGMSADWPTLHIILPVGISFYTFLSMSYTIDVYRREIAASRHFVDFALFVSYFPHLVAGPIVRASYLLPQCSAPRIIVPKEVINGLWLILLGMVKKVVIADQLAGIANQGFSSQTAPYADVNAWWFVLAFTFQIYGDFSGYTDMARGLAKTMGFELTENFRAPYLVTGASQFWQHWHISLSTWLRDYLYIPLGGNRLGVWKTYRNLMITMLLGGLWHGAGVAYLLWGLYHGLLLCIQRVWTTLTGRREEARGLGRVGSIAFFFILTCIGWLIFRAGSCPPEIKQDVLIWSYLKAMVTPASEMAAIWRSVVVLSLAGLAMQWFHRPLDHFSQWPLNWKMAGVGSGLALICVLGVFDGSQFIYFQF